MRRPLLTFSLLLLLLFPLDDDEFDGDGDFDEDFVLLKENRLEPPPLQKQQQAETIMFLTNLPSIVFMLFPFRCLVKIKKFQNPCNGNNIYAIVDNHVGGELLVMNDVIK